MNNTSKTETEKAIEVSAIPYSESKLSICNAFCGIDTFDELRKNFEKELKRREKWEQKMWAMLYKYQVGDRVILKSNLRGATIVKLRKDVKNYDDFKYEAKLDFDSNTDSTVSLKDSEIECVRPSDDKYIEMLVKRICNDNKENTRYN